MVVVGVPFYGFHVWSGRFLVTEAIWMWALYTLYGFAMLWPVLAFMGDLHGLFGQPKSVQRAFLSGIGTWCGFMTLPVLFWSIPWFGPTLRDKFWGNDTKLMAFAIMSALVPVLLALFTKTKRFSEHLRRESERAEKAREWERLELCD